MKAMRWSPRCAAGKKYRGETGPGLEVVEADFKDAAAMRPLVERCSRVVHVAAMTSQSCPDYEQYRQVNAEASRRLAGTCRRMRSGAVFCM